MKRCFICATCPPTNKVQYWHSQDIQEELAAVTVRTLNHNPKQKDWAVSNLLLKPASLDSHGIAVGRKVEENKVKDLEEKNQSSLPCVSCLLASSPPHSETQERALVLHRDFQDLLECWTTQMVVDGGTQAACSSLFSTHCNFHFPCWSHFRPQAKN